MSSREHGIIIPELQSLAEEKIQSGAFITDDPLKFIESLSLSGYPEMLTFYSIEQLRNMRFFLVSGFNIGFALHTISESQCDIVSVHNNQHGVVNIGRLLLQQAIVQGGNHLDHFGTSKLNNLYESLGFEEYKREAYNPEYDPDGYFFYKHGAIPVIYRRLKTQ